MSNRVAEVFLLMPFNKAFDHLHGTVVAAGEAEGARVQRADDIFQSGIFLDQIIERIKDADAIVAVCTGLNPNVFFELGIADRWHWPILLAEEDRDLPSDIRHYRALIYGDVDQQLFRAGLMAAIRETLVAGRKGGAGGKGAGKPPEHRARVLGQSMMQVHVWGLEREGSMESIPVDLLFLVQDIALYDVRQERAVASDFPLRDAVIADRTQVVASAESHGLVVQNFDPSRDVWYLVLTDKARDLLVAYERFTREFDVQS